MRTLFIFESHPVQYHAPVYRALHELCQAHGGAAVQVIYATAGGHYDPGFRRVVSWDEALLEGYPSLVLNSGRGDSLERFSSITGRGIPKLLRTRRPSAVLLTKLRHAFDWTAYLSALTLRIPIWLRTETQDQAFKRSRLKSVLRSLAYRATYLAVERAFPIGKLNAEHYSRHGVPLARQTPSRYCVVDRFAALSAKQKSTLRAERRRKLNIGDDITLLLFCGKLQPKKNPEAILHALATLPMALRKSFAVLYVGEGELQRSLVDQAAQLKEVPITFAGFQNQNQIAPWYLASDVLVLPSRQCGETWGLVANEALLAERRVILSVNAGCHRDFSVLPSVRVFDGSVAGLAHALRTLPLPESTANQRRMLESYSIQAAARGMAAALGIEMCTQKRDAMHDLNSQLQFVSPVPSLA